MNKQIVFSDKAPAPIGPYSQAVIINGFLYMSGQVAINQASGELEMDNISIETERVMENISLLLDKAGYTFDHIIKSTIFLKSMDDFNSVNEVYGKYFSSHYPARACVEVSRLPKNVNVEIEVIAYK